MFFQNSDRTVVDEMNEMKGRSKERKKKAKKNQKKERKKERKKKKEKRKKRRIYPTRPTVKLGKIQENPVKPSKSREKPSKTQ